MDSKQYLKSYGWKEGEAFKNGGLKNPILVKHKRDKKGLGRMLGQDDSDPWWERLFDGQLKNLNVNCNNEDNIIFEQKKHISPTLKCNSSLYKWFVKGESLKGTITNDIIENKTPKVTIERTKTTNDISISKSKLKKHKKDKNKINKKSTKRDLKSSRKKKKHSKDKNRREK